MKKVKTLGIFLLVATCAACLSLAFVACSGGEKNASYGAGEEGFYYYDGADSARYMLSLQSGNYMITASGDTAYSGSYDYDEESGEISFTGDANFTAAMSENALSLEMADTGYSFKAYRYFDVTYVDENGKTIATESVLNGQSAEVLDIEKDGYWFIGWYEDANNSSEFAFDTSIAGNTTVYGWYIEKNLAATEYEITLDYGDGVTESVSTMNGAVWTLPADGVLGWWVSATNKSGELTYKYETGTAFTSDATLFAVYSGIGASVTGSGITWDTSLAGANVSVTITDESGETVVSASNLSSSSGSYTSADFTALGTGTYTVTVGSDTLTYVVNGLDRVSASSIDVIVNGDGRVITFAPVENATRYEITVTDGERTVTEDLGSRTYYNFSGWDMTKDGITFVVTAYADGYVSSVSDAYNYLLALDKVTIEIDGENVVWNRVDNALEYEVIIYGENDAVLDSFCTTDTSYSLKYYDAGTYTISVQPVTSGYWSEETKYSGYAKNTLASPVITSITDYSVTWDPVTGAISYVVSVNGTETEVTEGTTFYITDKTSGSYEIAVKAVETNGNDSSYSDSVTATNGAFSSAVSYRRNTVSWNYDVSATSYKISVNGDEKYTVTGTNSQEIELTKVGDNDVVVTAYSGSTAIGQASLTVYAYSVTLDGNGLTTDNDVVYVAQGDTLNLGGVSGEILDHADFLGWYTQADYTEGQSDAYEGKGSLVLDGSTFTGSRNTYLYAYWSYQYVDVKLVSNMGSMTDENGDEVESLTVKIKYNSTSFELPTPTPYDGADDFGGWNTALDGTGTSYTGQSGLSNGTAFAGETTLYAYYRALLYYERTTYNGETVYSVSAGPEIASAENGEITIPESYNGCGLVLNANAFNDCTNLVTINIPDTILYVAVTYDGYTSGSGAFAGCSALKEVNVYPTGSEPDSTKEIKYLSDESGVLYHVIDDEGDVELLYYPYAKTGAYVMPSVVANEYEADPGGASVTHKVTTIPTRVFRNRQISEITISSNVTTIETEAFYGNTYLTKITFASGGTDSLTLEDGAFRNCSKVTGVTLPARCSEFNPLAFDGCTSLTTVNVVETGGKYISDSGVLLENESHTLAFLPTGRSGAIDLSTLTTTSILAVGANAFVSNTQITSVVVSADITEIGESAFEGCVGMETVEFKGITDSANLRICSRAFYGCTRLRSVTLPVNLTVMEKDAFGACSSISYVYFDARSRSSAGTGENEINFATGSFGSDNYITTLELGANVPELDFANIFGGSSLDKVVIDSANTSYMSDSYGAVYNTDDSNRAILYYPLGRKGEYTVYGDTKTIGKNVFTDRINLTKINIGASVENIASDAFDGCVYLTEINVDSNNTTYGSLDGILYKKDDSGNLVELILCPKSVSVTSITVPSTVTTVDAYSLEDCITVISISFANCTSLVIGEGALNGMTALVNVTLPTSGITEIPTYAFYGDTSLTGDLTGGTLKLPESVTTIGYGAFYNCQSLALTIPSQVMEIDDYAFWQCWYTSSAQAEIVFESMGDNTAPDLTIGERAFYYCRYATSLEIPANVTSIGSYSFYYFGYSLSSETTLTFETGSKITAIPEQAFYYAKNVKSLELPDTVTTIGSKALSYMTSLAEITIPASVTTIGASAFENDTSLAEIVFADNCVLTEIASTAFSKTVITSMEIPASVTTLGDKVFYSCTSLVTVTFADGSPITKIDSSTFSGCSKLAEIELPSGIQSIGASAFINCTALTSIEIPSTVLSIGSNAFSGCTALTELKFEEDSSLESVATGAFAGCSSLDSFVFPETKGQSITLASSIFAAPDRDDNMVASPIKSVHLSNGVTELGSALGYCKEIMTITVSETNTVYEVDENGAVLYGKDRGEIAYIFGLIESITIPSYVTSIGSFAFESQTKLTEITIPATVSTIGEYAFENCTSLSKVTIEEGSALAAGSFGQYVFNGCTSLKSFTIPSGFTSVPDYMFYGCTNLATVTVPDTVTTIGSYAFRGTAIAAIDLTHVTAVGGYAFQNCSELEDVTIGNTLNLTGNYTFGNCVLLNITTLPEGVTSIPQYTFYGCTGLTYFVVPSSVTKIDNYAFSNCTGLVEIVLPEGLTEIGTQAFIKCTSLSVCNIPSTCKTFGQKSLENTKLESIVIPDGCTSLPNYLAENNNYLVSVVLPDTVTAISSYAFYNCPLLETVTMGRNVTTVNSYAFANDTKLKSIELGPCLTTIGANAFDGSGLESVEIGANVKTISNYSFRNCANLKEVTLQSGLETISTSAFQNCTKLQSIVIPVSVSSVMSNAFAGVKSCDIYVRNSLNYVTTYWTSGWNDSGSTVYYYSADEPSFNDNGTNYDDNYWYYGAGNEIIVWSFDYVTYTAEDGSYVLYSETDDTIACICFVNTETVEDGEDEDPVEITTVTLCMATSCESENNGYTVTLEDGSVYTVVLSGTTATITEAVA